MTDLPHWADVLKTDKFGAYRSGCMCGHFEDCSWCSNVEWTSPAGDCTKPETYINGDYVVGSNNEYRWICSRKYAKSKGWKIEEIADLLKDKRYWS